jgi:hypothetical protein
MEYRVHMRPSLDSVLSQINSLHSLCPTSISKYPPIYTNAPRVVLSFQAFKLQFCINSSSLLYVLCLVHNIPFNLITQQYLVKSTVRRINIKDKTILVTRRGFPVNQVTDGGEVVSIISRPLFIRRNIPGTHFC